MTTSVTSSEGELASVSIPASTGAPRWTLAASFGAIGIGTLVLLGWAFEIEALKRVVPILVAMNPLTAVCFILAGAALYGLRSPTSSLALISRLGASIVALV